MSDRDDRAGGAMSQDTPGPGLTVRQSERILELARGEAATAEDFAAVDLFEAEDLEMPREDLDLVFRLARRARSGEERDRRSVAALAAHVAGLGIWHPPLTRRAGPEPAPAPGAFQGVLEALQALGEDERDDPGAGDPGAAAAVQAFDDHYGESKTSFGAYAAVGRALVGSRILACAAVGLASLADAEDRCREANRLADAIIALEEG